MQPGLGDGAETAPCGTAHPRLSPGCQRSPALLAFLAGRWAAIVVVSLLGLREPYKFRWGAGSQGAPGC